MSSRKKLIVSLLIIPFVLLSVIATVAVVFALTQQTIKTSLSIGYSVEDIDGTASATFTVGGVTENLVAMKGSNVIGDKLVFKAGDTEDAGNLMFPEDALALTAQNDNVVIQYTYSNTGEKHYIASMDFAANIETNNMKVEYSIDGKVYSDQRYAVVVPAKTENKSYWIRIKIDNLSKSASFQGSFNWLLAGCDPQSEEYLTLTSAEFKAVEGQTGAYSVKLANAGEYIAADKVVFPSEVNGSAVTAIAESSLSDSEKGLIKKVNIPTSVETIKENAFADFTNLSEVVIEQNSTASGASAQASGGLKTIEKYAFKNCISLTEFTFPSSLEKIACGEEYTNNGYVLASAFAGCDNLKTITTNTTIDDLANILDYMSVEHLIFGDEIINFNYFYDWDRVWEGFKEVTIGKNITDLGWDFGYYGNFNKINVHPENTTYRMQNNCLISGTTLVKAENKASITIPDGITHISTGAFSYNELITQIELPDSVEYVYEQSLAAPNLTEIKLSSNLKYIDLWALTGTSITSIVIPDSVTYIGQGTFQGCSELVSVTLPSNLTSIDCRMFEGCSKLESITIGASVQYICCEAFAGCINLRNAIFEDPEGWYVKMWDENGDEIEQEFEKSQLENPQTAASLLIGELTWLEWFKK